MLFCGCYQTIVSDTGEFSIPEFYKPFVEVGAKYDVFYYPSEWEKGLLYISFVFENSDHYCDAMFISSGFVTEDKKLKVPDAYIERMKDKCELIGNATALELSKVSLEKLLDDIQDINELDIIFE